MDVERITSRVTSQNQISVPAEVRRRFGIGPGSVLIWEECNGELRIRPKRHTLEDVQEILSERPVDRLSLDELDAARRAAASRYRRGRR